jgi:hypothetical protein
MGVGARHSPLRRSRESAKGVRNTPRELDTSSGELSVERIRVLNDQVAWIAVFLGIRRRRFGAAEVDSVLVAAEDSVDRRVLPGG